MIKEMLNYMENDGTIPKREVVTPPDPEDDTVTEVQCTQCGNLRIFLLLRFYVKPILENVEVLKVPFLQF